LFKFPSRPTYGITLREYIRRNNKKKKYKQVCDIFHQDGVSLLIQGFTGWPKQKSFFAFNSVMVNSLQIKMTKTDSTIKNVKGCNSVKE